MNAKTFEMDFTFRGTKYRLEVFSSSVGNRITAVKSEGEITEALKSPNDFWAVAAAAVKANEKQ